MKTDYDALLFATRLVEELGETAIRVSRVRLVELTAANNLRAAAFWRDVMRTCERLVSERAPPLPTQAAAAAVGATALAKTTAP
ncbi:hypothetical protein [Azospirillum sp. SYSU D00513]|uniref:hypothetical protein n=1 Tax=Azospirillum sp. SYSU D00513 TaxID=2812561 RepID=UPI001FFEE7B5|nr:hypothetical protein [Azospirillum sp. SYSU D00513]